MSAVFNQSQQVKRSKVMGRTVDKNESKPNTVSEQRQLTMVIQTKQMQVKDIIALNKKSTQV